MTEPEHVPLRWTTQLTVADSSASSTSLQGDKILLPPSALEQLLSAATTIVTGQDNESYSPWGIGNGPMRILDRKQDLPHPLTFRLVSPTSGNVVYAGIRQFTAEEDQIQVSSFLRRVLDLKDDDDALARVTVHAQELPKGTYVKLRPLEAGYDADWKPLLERYMRTNFTTLTKGVILDVPAGEGSQYRFLVDELKPEGTDAVCIVDTDLEVDIEALNEEQAQETVKRQAEKQHSGGTIQFGQVYTGQVTEDGYVDYTLAEWDRSKDIVIELNCEGEVDLLLSPLSSRQRHRPREDEHVIGCLEGSPRRIELRTTNIELDHAEQLYISAHGYESASFSITVKAPDHDHSTTAANTTTQPGPDEVICKNCHQSIPKRTLMLHESFCYRNNIACPKCLQVFQKKSPDWTSHWHCPHDSAYGNTSLSFDKHNNLHHSPRICPGCTESHPSTLLLAQHRTTTCPAKEILCQFCHLLVPQQGPEDPPFTSAEVLLSGLTPHELLDGARTTDCHLCGKFIRLRDMPVHMRHHNLARLSKVTPRLCRNVNCGRTVPSPSSTSHQTQVDTEQLGLCNLCFAPLYTGAHDPERKALRRRLERRYLTQFLSGCGRDWCRNEYCRTAREYLGLPILSSKEGLVLVKDDLDTVVLGNQQGISVESGGNNGIVWHFCADSEDIQKRRLLAAMLTAQDAAASGGGGGGGDNNGGNGVNGGRSPGKGGYELGWWIKGLEENGNDISKAKTWLADWGRERDE